MFDNHRTLTKSITYDDLVITIHGGNPNEAGTWLHPKLAVIFARWLSAHFAVWCDKKIAGLLQQNPEYQKQFPELSVIFEKLEKSQQQLSIIFEKLERNQQQFKHELEQRFEESINTTAQIFNNLHTKLAQDNKHSLG